ncbi:hypothetical protein E8D34_19080 [Nocardioides sp. GY 10113]|uniref:DUF3303 domain-containing protein n=1 Tax=Nocardioides sp. GY 10113 TaxID=2569761 RepID=UPI0010A89B26|nr:DUF3303 family protein [Nocardioides sp. GY 10113]TIC80487.1 hypothetical protein E8D34_19080 [Nocardioides sp. GY 10113]
MLFLTTYHVRPFLTKAEVAAMMGVFAEVGDAPGVQAHYVHTDGSGGTLLTENDDPTVAYRHLLNFGEWMEFDTKVVLPVDDAVPHILDALS